MSGHAVMRRRILEILVYPRRVAKANVDLSTCPNSGIFNVIDARCSECAKSYECDWLNSTDEFNDLGRKPMEFLHRALAFGIDYVDAHNTSVGHDGAGCDCESCEWVRDARHLAAGHIQDSTPTRGVQIQEDRS